MGEFGIVANVVEPDRVFRMNAKAWLIGGTGGEGWYRFLWSAKSRGSRTVEKWAPTERFHMFRAAWIPPGVRPWYITGTREEMEATATKMNAFADELRATKKNRPNSEWLAPTG